MNFPNWFHRPQQPDIGQDSLDERPKAIHDRSFRSIDAPSGKAGVDSNVDRVADTFIGIRDPTTLSRTVARDE